jgi:hypothetical protein
MRQGLQLMKCWESAYHDVFPSPELRGLRLDYRWIRFIYPIIGGFKFVNFADPIDINLKGINAPMLLL